MVQDERGARSCLTLSQAAAMLRSADFPQLRDLRDQRRMIEIERELSPPAGVVIDRPGHIELVKLGKNIVQLSKKQSC